MRSLAGAPFGLVREMRRSLGAVPRPFLGQTDTQDLEDEFATRWSEARILQERARIEQEFLGRFGNRALSWEAAMRTEVAREPRQAGRIVELIDGSDRAARFLDNVANVLPTTGQAWPASAGVGLPWIGPADALVARFRAVRAAGCLELENMRRQFERYPATPTPRVCPTAPKPPTPGQLPLPSGEPGGRPRTFIDDALDWIKEKAKFLALLGLLGAWGYAVYETSIEPGDQPEPRPKPRAVRRRHVPVRA